MSIRKYILSFLILIIIYSFLILEINNSIEKEIYFDNKIIENYK